MTPSADEINTKLIHEGWAIFSTLGTDDEGDWRIERDDELALFPNDQAVWQHVYDLAAAGSAWHQAALEFIRDNNPTEWETINAAIHRT
jgi:hypothetical protein